MSLAAKQTIYIALLNEGADCWRPACAVAQGNGFRILPTSDYDPVHESRAFLRGSLVRCEVKVFSGGATGLVAVEMIT